MCLADYSCTCDKANAAYIDSIPAIINTSRNDFSSKTCIHINATQMIASTDNIEELTPSLTDDHCYEKKHETEGLYIWEVDFPEPMVGVFGYDGLPGVVGKSNAEKIPDALIQLQILVEQTQENPVPTYTYQSVSKERIQFKPSDHVQEYLTGDYSNCLLEDGFYHFWPDEDSNCPSCGSSWSEECFQQGKDDFIYLDDLYHVLKAKVYGKDCSNEDCSEKLMFDGGIMAILSALYTHTSRSGKSIRMILEVINIPFDQEFQCNTCKDSPSIVVCDATSLACQKTFVNWTESEPYHDDKPLIEGR
ncbi:unnamed protein product [Mytilus coruscus]|uniref:Uncharacterized protein n=1 Tax=Mytilus coruscus TaxID=42192 RepID=A0A6J8DWY8_MYTCO|nr:unnamed protein product [Mytilus coruscus]